MEDLVSINDFLVDINSLYSIEHQCTEGFCDIKTCCCADYEVCIDYKELSSIVRYLDVACTFTPQLKENGEFNNVFDKICKNLYSIDTTDEGLCVFAYIKYGRVLCSLHSTAIELSISPFDIKPKTCLLWPLSVTEDYPIVLSVDDDAFSYACNKKRPQSVTDLSPSIATIVEHIFGHQFLEELDLMANLRLHKDCS